MTSNLLHPGASEPCSALPCSGMLPGYVAGWYAFDDCHLDLGRLARFARARLVLAPAVGLDLKVQCLLGDLWPQSSLPPAAHILLHGTQ